MNVFKMAWRNVWRNHRRSGITIAAMAFALVAELLYAGLVSGMVGGMEEDATEYDLGDLQVMVDGYLTRPSLYDAIPDAAPLVAGLEAQDFRVSPRLFAGGLAASGEASSGAAFVGVDAVKDAAAMSLDDAIAEGAWLDAAAPKGVLVGRGLARTLGLSLGSEVLVVSQAADGSVANDLFEVRGILKSVAASMDRSTILMNEAAFRDLMAFPEGAHKLVLRRPPTMSLEDARAAVTALVAAHSAEPVLDVMTWKDINPFLAQWLESVSSVVLVLYFIVYVAVAILILNAMLMAVFERIRELGVLKAIGFSPWQVFVLMVSEALIQATVALFVGLTLAAPGMWYLSTTGIDVSRMGGMNMAGMTMPAIWQAEYTVQIVQVPILMLFFIAIAAVLYPAIKAARIRPVEAMTHQ